MQRIGDAASGHRPHQIPGWVRRRRGRPPRHYGRVRHEQWDDQRIRVVDQAAARAQDDDLSRAGVRAEPHLGVQVGAARVVRPIGQVDGRIVAIRAHLGGRFGRVRLAIGGPGDGIGVRHHGDHAARMLAAGRIRGLQRMLQIGVLGGDQQRQYAAGRRFAALLMQLFDLVRDFAGTGIRHVDDHGILQWRPSRASMSSAWVGPHVPER